MNMFVREWESRNEEYFRDNNELMLPWILWLLLQNLRVVTMELGLLCAAEYANDLSCNDLLQQRLACVDVWTLGSSGKCNILFNS